MKLKKLYFHSSYCKNVLALTIDVPTKAYNKLTSLNCTYNE